MTGSGNCAKRVYADELFFQAGRELDVLEVDAGGCQIRTSLGQPQRPAELRLFPGSVDGNLGDKLSEAFPDRSREQGGHDPLFLELSDELCLQRSLRVDSNREARRDRQLKVCPCLAVFGHI